MKIIPMNTDARSIVDMIYPIGSYYWSSNATNPSSIFGGTWEQVKDRFVLAAGDSYKVGATGGEAQHTLTVDEMPGHRHSSDTYQNGFANAGIADTDKYCTWVNRGTPNNNNPNTAENGPIRTSWVGGSRPHNNMPPYIVAYCWHRTA